MMNKHIREFACRSKAACRCDGTGDRVAIYANGAIETYAGAVPGFTFGDPQLALIASSRYPLTMEDAREMIERAELDLARRAVWDTELNRLCRAARSC